MRKIKVKDAIDKINNICDQYRVPIIQYTENDIPEGRQATDDVISIKRKFSVRTDEDGAYYYISYCPWIRVLPNDLTIEEFEKILSQGENVKQCVIELNQFLNDVLIEFHDE